MQFWDWWVQSALTAGPSLLISQIICFKAFLCPYHIFLEDCKPKTFLFMLNSQECLRQNRKCFFSHLAQRAIGWTGPQRLSLPAHHWSLLHWDLHTWEDARRTESPRRTRRMTVNPESVICNERTGVALAYASDFPIMFFTHAKGCCKEGAKCSSCSYRTWNNIIRCSAELPVRH